MNHKMFSIFDMSFYLMILIILWVIAICSCRKLIQWINRAYIYCLPRFKNDPHNADKAYQQWKKNRKNNVML